MAIGILILSFIVLFMLGIPIVLALYAPAILYLLFNGYVLETFSVKILYSLNSYTLLAVPLFILVGNMMSTSGISVRIFNFANSLVGKLHGGLAQVNILASLIFAGMSGSALADVGGLGKIEIEEMRRHGFSKAYSGAVTVASATLGPIFPPSIPMILWASVASASPVLCLMAGIVPAVLAASLMMITAAIIGIVKRHPRNEEPFSLVGTMKTFVSAFPALLAPVILISGMLTGIFTPTEVAAIAVAYILLINTFIYREFDWKNTLRALKESVVTISGIMMIFPAASLYTMILTLNDAPQTFAAMMLGISSNINVLFLLLNIMLLVVGMFMGNTEAILLIVPIVAPLMTGLGVDVVHLAIVMVFNLMIGLITPPFAMSLYLGADMAKVSMQKLLKDMLPYFIPLLVALALITYVPGISTFIPNMLR